MKAVTAASAFALYLSLVAAQSTTLFIPGFDPQAITADVEGVDAQGRTTYRIGGGVSSGTFDVGGNPPGASGTLVAGPTEAHLVYNLPADSIAISEDCSINGAVAVCTGLVSAPDVGVQTISETETASGFVVQGNTAAAPTAAGSNTNGATSTPTAGTNPASPTAASTDAASPTTTSGGKNGAARVGSSLTASLGVVGLVAAFFL